MIKTNTNKIIYLNNNFVSEQNATVSVYDRGFLFADGVYEVIPVYHNNILFLKEHLDRLQQNINYLKINYSIDFNQWQNICSKLINTNGPNGPIYIQITRGNEHVRNHDYNNNIVPTVIAYSLAEITLGSCLKNPPVKVITKEDNRWNHCNIKSIALLGNILLRQEGKQEGAEEVLLIRENNSIVEGTVSNYFIVKNNIIMTPPLSNNILPGITREIIINLCKKNNLKLVEHDIDINQLINSDEVWLSSSTKEIRPVSQVNQTVINNGQPGPIWQKVANLYIDHIKQLININNN